MDRHRRHDRRAATARRPRCCPMARCSWRAAEASAATASSHWPRPNCTTRAAGPGPPPGTWPRSARVTRPRCCPTARCSWRAAPKATTNDCPRPNCTTPAAGSWTATGNMVAGRVGHTATLLPDGKVLVAGGRGKTERNLASAELYDPSSGSWTATGKHGRGPRPLKQPRCCPMEGCSSRAAGTTDILASAELYDPSSGTWTATGNMAGYQGSWAMRPVKRPRCCPMARCLWWAARPPTRGRRFAAELYDPGSGSWTFTGPMTERALRSHGHAAARWQGACGGRRQVRTGPLDSAELYDPSTGSWTAAGNMITGR